MLALATLYLLIFNFIDLYCFADVIDCAKSAELCRNNTVSCTQNTDCSISCHEPHNCMQSKLICPKIGNCLISCDADSSCEHSQIIGPTEGHLIIHCVGKRSCLNAVFNASESSTLTITGCAADASCYDLSIYCPIHKTGSNHKNCFIQGNNNLGAYNKSEGIEIYAINSWNDVEINYFGSFSTSHRGIMYCGEAYNKSCNISVDDWSCGDLEESCSVDLLYDVSSTQQLDFIYARPKDKMNGYFFVGAWVLALAFAYITCGAIKHSLKSAVEKKNRSASMSEDTDSDEAEVIPDGRTPMITVDV